ncbi:MAG: hypothetical protein QOH96_4094, partial [Blastocatellia bacterium]|nr:hypothetical protein [Blastocatellia bacterium]
VGWEIIIELVVVKFVKLTSVIHTLDS